MVPGRADDDAEHARVGEVADRLTRRIGVSPVVADDELDIGTAGAQTFARHHHALGGGEDVAAFGPGGPRADDDTDPQRLVEAIGGQFEAGGRERLPGGTLGVVPRLVTRAAGGGHRQAEAEGEGEATHPAPQPTLRWKVKTVTTDDDSSRPAVVMSSSRTLA